MFKCFQRLNIWARCERYFSLSSEMGRRVGISSGLKEGVRGVMVGNGQDWELQGPCQRAVLILCQSHKPTSQQDKNKLARLGA